MAKHQQPPRQSLAQRKRAANQAASLQASPEYAVRAILDGLDAYAHEMEMRWGIGRLRLLVGDELRAKFDAQCDKLDAAVGSGSVELIKLHGEAMRRAWGALDRAAMEAGAYTLPGDMWECIVPSTGEVVGIVRDQTLVLPRPGQAVFTLAEIGCMIDAAGGDVLAVKREFAGSVVSEVRPATIDWDKGDDLPDGLR